MVTQDPSRRKKLSPGRSWNEHAPKRRERRLAYRNHLTGGMIAFAMKGTPEARANTPGGWARR